MHEIHVLGGEKIEGPKLEVYSMIQEFIDVFRDGIPSFPTNMDIEFSINQIPSDALL